MNTTAIAAAIRSRSSAPAVARARDFFELTKPRLSMMVLVTVAATMVICADSGSLTAATLALVVAATGLVAASACVWNQIVERDIDLQMVRTADRPLPAGRVGAGEASLFAIALLLAGCTGLMFAGGVWSALLGLGTWLVYVVVYTPMKQRSAWNTFFGAIAGAMPVLIGWSATESPLASSALTKSLIMFAIVFAWQFPHFMAIAWKYREDYAAASLKMASVTDPSGKLAGWIALGAAFALIPITASLALLDESAACLVIIGLLGVWQLMLVSKFARKPTEATAKTLLRATLVYLPLIMLCATLMPLM